MILAFDWQLPREPGVRWDTEDREKAASIIKSVIDSVMRAREYCPPFDQPTEIAKVGSRDAWLSLDRYQNAVGLIMDHDYHYRDVSDRNVVVGLTPFGLSLVGWADIKQACADHHEYVRRQIEYQSRMRAPGFKLRYQVLRRDGWRCQCCGATEYLHIDHIYPFAKGGLTAMDNLQVLCRACNTRKRDRLITLEELRGDAA